MENGWRWAVVVVVLTVAGIVAIWPRDGSETTSEPAGSAPQATPSADTSARVTADDDGLASARRHAALRPCPSQGADRSASTRPLAGVTVRCLGTPGTVDVGAALAGKATLLNLWASWCVPCREEMPVLAAYAERPGAIPVLGVDIQEPASAGLDFMAQIGVRYPSLYDGDQTLQRALRTPPVLPVNYLVRPDGSVQRITAPLVFRSPGQIQKTVDRLLASAPAHENS